MASPEGMGVRDPQRDEAEEALRRVAPIEADDRLRAWFAQELEDRGSGEMLEFLRLIGDGSGLGLDAEEAPDILTQLWLEHRGIDLDAPGALDRFVRNARVRRAETARNREEVAARIAADPLASAEEYAAGTYREALESQVRDAVFAMQAKGYRPFESGFHDLADGSQYVGVRPDPGMDRRAIELALGPWLEEQGVALIYNEDDDRIQVILRPAGRELSLADWKRIWDEFAGRLPAIEHPAPPVADADGSQWSAFRRRQDALREKA